MKYHYKIITPAGDNESGVTEAANNRAALRELVRAGSVVVELKPVKNKIAGNPASIKAPAILQLFDELVTLLVAGVALIDALESLAEAQLQPTMAQELDDIVNGLEQGKSFSEVLTESGLNIPDYIMQLTAAGELSGKLAESLSEGVNQMRFDEDIRTETRNALIYPAVLVVSGILAVSLVFALVVPKFTNLLTNGADLPWLGAVVLKTGLFFNENGLYMLVVLALTALALVNLLAKPHVRNSLLNNMTRWPLIGEWLIESETGRWTSILAALLQSGVPLMDALELANKGVRIPVRQKKLNAAMVAVKSGESLSAALEAQNALLPTAYNILKVGERAGELPAMLRSLATLYDKSGKTRMKRMLVLIEPLAILLIGGAIGVIILGIILAITSATDIPL